MSDLDPTLEAEVRRAEADLWLTSRLVDDPARRAALIALYAVHVELGKVVVAATNPLAGEIRLAWWREEAEALHVGARALGHPALQALQRAGLDRAALDAMIEGRHAELEASPFEDENQLVNYIDSVHGGLMRGAVSLLAPGTAPRVTATARAWGWAHLLRDRIAWRARGRDWAPASWMVADGLSDLDIAAHVRHRMADALKLAHEETALLPTAAFPAIAVAALARLYAKGRHPSPIEKRLRLLWASARGRV